MNKTKSFFHLIVTKAAALAVVAAVVMAAPALLFAQTADVRYAGVFYKDYPTTVKGMYCDYSEEESFVDFMDDVAKGNDGTYSRSFTYHSKGSSDPSSAMFDGTIDDPWVTSALIEYDQPFPTDAASGNKYPNHCLALCMNVYCNNRPLSGATYSISFPLQEIKFEVVKFYNQKNLADAEGVQAQRTIYLFPDQEHSKCGSYQCPGGPEAGYTCSTPAYELRGEQCVRLTDDATVTGHCTIQTGCDGDVKVCDYVIFNEDGAATNTPMPYCASWDGSYDIAGEFGKTNGQFGFRASVKTDSPGDNVIVDKISFNSTIVYPSMNQIPIQVDVTNVHTVRSTPSMVGSITSVPAQPYTYSYRLSKDADVRVAVFDASTQNADSYGNYSEWDVDEDALVRVVNDWQPRMGEGAKGVEKDVQITEFDSWDGRDENGLLLPAGNYVVSLQAKSQDEWPGVDFSRAVTRQLSLDPLKLTDVRVMALNKQSTAYAAIQYVPTESAKIYWNIYTPGTVFDDVTTNSAAITGTGPDPVAGSLVYSAVENRTGRMIFTSKWDGLCGNEQGCQRVYAKNEKTSTGKVCNGTDYPFTQDELGTDLDVCVEYFAPGTPMPDGNYVYALWAEIPYNGCYYNKASGVANAPIFVGGEACADATANGQQFTGVKTLKYSIGNISIDRGVVDITVQPVSYSTVGSSPTAYGLDPFIFKYSIAREATVVAKVENTAGVIVKYLTPQDGITQVAQQMNTISWDGRDDAGRMVYPGTYMFVVETKDAMFPSVTNRASAVFPVDMYRVVDVYTTDVYGDSNAKATISYKLSKAMNAQINIYNKDVVIPNYNATTGEYGGYTVLATYTGKENVTDLTQDVSIEPTGGVEATLDGGTMSSIGSYTAYLQSGTDNYINEWSVSINPAYVKGSTLPDQQTKYIVSLTQKKVALSGGTQMWPPSVCNKQTDKKLFCPMDQVWDATANTCGGTGDQGLVDYVVPARVSDWDACIYVRDTSFKNYPATLAQAQSGIVDVRLQPIHTFDRSSTRVGEGFDVTEEWDALYFYNPNDCSKTGTTRKEDCKYSMLPDGQYPFFISARSDEPFDRYYAHSNEKYVDGTQEYYYLEGAPFKKDQAVTVQQEEYLYATDKPVGKINITRGPVYFLDGSTVVYPNAPQLFNVSSGPIFVPPYEINFAVSRAATVEVAVVALQDNVCTSEPNVSESEKNNKAGDVCKYLSTMTIANTSNFDPNMVRKMYWDGTDMNGFYVKPGVYEIRLTAKNYPDAGLYQPTVKSITLNADLLKVFDLFEADNYAISARGTDMSISYQISVPMKVAIQIFKPGTTIFDYQKGTLRDPATGKEVQNIRDVLVKSIVGIRPAATLIEESWDGTDYAGQEVPDGTYPFRFVTALNSADIDTVTGEIIGDYADTDAKANPTAWKINKVADTYEYQNLHKATIAIGDGRFVCSDWEKTVFFYPNPLKNADRGTLEITKMPVPGEVSIKFFNLAGDLVRDSGYTCVDANNYQITMGGSLSFNPDNDPIGATKMTEDELKIFPSQRNAALRCRWDRTNQHGKKVARGVYFGLVDFKAKNGREHCQKVVKVLVP